MISNWCDISFNSHTHLIYQALRIGLCHMGYAIDAFTPTHRGFDHFYGFYQG